MSHPLSRLLGTAALTLLLSGNTAFAQAQPALQPAVVPPPQVQPAAEAKPAPAVKPTPKHKTTKAKKAKKAGGKKKR